MFERFTGAARKCMALANQEAQRMGHTHIDTGHMLLGLLKEERDCGSRLLAPFGMAYRAVRGEVERLTPPTDEYVVGKLPQTPLAKQAILYAIEGGRALDHRHVGTEHFVLALARQREGTAAKILNHYGVSEDAVVESIKQLAADPRGVPATPDAVPAPPPPSAELVWKYALIRQYRGYLQHLDARRLESERLGAADVATYHKQAADVFQLLVTRLESSLPDPRTPDRTAAPAPGEP